MIEALARSGRLGSTGACRVDRNFRPGVLESAICYDALLITSAKTWTAHGRAFLFLLGNSKSFQCRQKSNRAQGFVWSVFLDGAAHPANPAQWSEPRTILACFAFSLTGPKVCGLSMPATSGPFAPLQKLEVGAGFPSASMLACSRRYGLFAAILSLVLTYVARRSAAVGLACFS